jgi:hypothetical protein
MGKFKARTQRKEAVARRKTVRPLSELPPQRIDPDSTRPVYLTVPETAALWRVSPATVRHKLATKQIARYKSFGRTLILLSDAEAAIKQDQP